MNPLLAYRFLVKAPLIDSASITEVELPRQFRVDRFGRWQYGELIITFMLVNSLPNVLDSLQAHDVEVDTLDSLGYAITRTKMKCFPVEYNVSPLSYHFFDKLKATVKYQVDDSVTYVVDQPSFVMNWR